MYREGVKPIAVFFASRLIFGYSFVSHSTILVYWQFGLVVSIKQTLCKLCVCAFMAHDLQRIYTMDILKE